MSTSFFSLKSDVSSILIPQRHFETHSQFQNTYCLCKAVPVNTVDVPSIRLPFVFEKDGHANIAKQLANEGKRTKQTNMHLLKSPSQAQLAGWR